MTDDDLIDRLLRWGGYSVAGAEEPPQITPEDAARLATELWDSLFVPWERYDHHTAIRLLGRSGVASEQVIDVLLLAVHHDRFTTEVRIAAAQALAQLGEATEKVLTGLSTELRG